MREKMYLLSNKLKEILLKLVIKKCFKFFGQGFTNITVSYSNTDALINECGKKEKVILITSNKIITYEYYCDIKMQLTTTSYINLDFFLRFFFHNYVDALAHSYLLNISKNQNSVHKTKKSDAERVTEVTIFMEKKTVIADQFFDKFDNFIAGYIFKITQLILFGRPDKFISSPLDALKGEWQERDSRWVFDNQQLCLIENRLRQNFTYKTIADNRNILKLDTTNIENKEIRIKRTFYFDSDMQTLQQRSHGTSLTIWKRIK